MGKTFRKALFSGVAALSAAGLTALAPITAAAQQCDGDERSRRSQTLNPRIAQALGTIFEQMQAEQYQEALGGLNQLIGQRGDGMADFDRATTYELRGSVKANLEDYPGALRDFQVALNTNALPPSRNNQLRYFVAQINFQLEQYQNAISGLNNWINNARACGETVDANAYYLLAAAYTQVSPPNWRAAVGPARQAVDASPEPKKSQYDLLNLVYSELNDNNSRTPLLERMINFWPGEKGYWTQLSGAYSTTGKDQDAFSVLEVAYRAGLLATESELLTLIQYYSFFDNPYRGAVMLDREMSAGNINRNQKNLVLLSQLWSQAREHKRSIPILREAAGRSSDGELYYRLGQVLLADEQYAAAQRALESAVNRGGMDARDTGDAWLLLGTARFSQAGPTDTNVWASARRAFVNAQRYDNARRRAVDWVVYIDAVRSTYESQVELERRQRLEQCTDDIARFERDARIRELQNRQPTAEERTREEQTRAACDALLAGNATEEAEDGASGDDDAPAEEAAADGAEEAAETAAEDGDSEE